MPDFANRTAQFREKVFSRTVAVRPLHWPRSREGHDHCRVFAVGPPPVRNWFRLMSKPHVYLLASRAFGPRFVRTPRRH